jgi:hypothetical protein
MLRSCPGNRLPPFRIMLQRAGFSSARNCVVRPRVSGQSPMSLAATIVLQRCKCSFLSTNVCSGAMGEILIPSGCLPLCPRQHTGGDCAALTVSSQQQTSPGRADFATIKSSAHSGTTAFALSLEKSAGASNLPVCRSYLQRQPFTTPVCMGLRPLTSASADRAITR